jgi:hypothetical protein
MSVLWTYLNRTESLPWAYCERTLIYLERTLSVPWSTESVLWTYLNGTEYYAPPHYAPPHYAPPHYAPPHYAPRRSHRSLTWLPTSVWKFLFFFSLFWSWVGGLLVLGCRPLSAANRVSHSKVCVSDPSYLPLAVPCIQVDSEICNRWLWTARNWGQQSLYLLYQKCSPTATFVAANPKHSTQQYWNGTPRVQQTQHTAVLEWHT